MKSAQSAPTAEPTDQAEWASQDKATGQGTATGQDTMRAIVQHRYGTVPEEVLCLERIARPRPAAATGSSCPASPPRTGSSGWDDD